MSIKKWCKECSAESEICPDPKHKPSHGYYADVQPSQEARRKRQFFHIQSAAEAWVRKVYIAHEQEKHLNYGSAGSKSFPSLIDEYEKDYASVRMKGYQDVESYRLKKFKEFYAKDNKSIVKLSTQDLEAWVTYRKGGGIATGTINRELTSIKRILSWALERDYIKINPFSRVKKLKGDNIRIRWLTEDEVKKLLDACEALGDNDLKDFISVALNTGFRKSNLRSLEARDIQNEVVTAKRTKSGEPYDVPLNSKMKLLFNKLSSLRPTGPLLNCDNLRSRFHRAVLKAKFETDKSNHEKVTIHTLRHTFASHYLQAGVSIFTVSKWLGHASVQMTQKVYGHLSPSHHKQEIQKLKGI